MIPTAMTLNDLNGVIALILVFFLPNSIALLATNVAVVENIPTMSVKYCLPVPVFHFWPLLTHPAARSLCDAELHVLVRYGYRFSLWKYLDRINRISTNSLFNLVAGIRRFIPEEHQ